MASRQRWYGKEGSDRRGDAIEECNKEFGNMATGAERRGSRCRGKLSPRVLADIVRRIVEVARPQQIVLFGSAARGAMGPNSDVDLLVVKSGRFHRGRLLEAIYRNLRGAAAPVDVLVVTPEELERYRGDPCLIVAPAVREGRLVYGSKTSAPQ